MAMQKLYRYALYLLFIISALVIAVGCKKDVVNRQPIPNPGGKQLLKVVEGNEFIDFAYNNEGFVSHVNANFDLGTGTQQFFLRISYKPNKEIETVATGTGLKTNYFYENGKISRMEQRDAAGNLIQLKQLYYQDSKLIRSTLSVPDQPGAAPEVVSEIQYVYFTVHLRNVREEIHFERNAAGNLIKSVIYKFEAYDGRLSPFSLLGDFGFAFFQQVNLFNPLTESIYDANYTLEGSNENSYTYDDDGYTLTQKQVVHRVSGPINKTRNITYIYN